MALKTQKKSFLPPGIMECLETQEMWEHTTKPSMCRFFDNQGFDGSGNYYTVTYKFGHNYNSTFITVYFYEDNKFKVKYVTFPEVDPNVFRTLFHSETLRWFKLVIQSSNMIKVYSGCLRSIFDVKEATKSTHSYEDTEDCSFDLIYSDVVVVNSCQIEFVKCYENGGNDYLVVMKQIEENKYTIDIIQFDEECV
eukprot:TCONS_00033086-protein